jgi:protein-serine/threonine kinase
MQLLNFLGNNILIQEDGSVQLCDFGVSGTLEPAVNKRSTIVGTPNWMAPELQQEWVKDANPQSRMEPKQILYASEVDIWAYGCTIYEMASGFPPFHRVNPFDLPNSGIPVLEGDRHSQELRDFLAFVFQTNPQDRPTPDKILEHPYLEGSTKMYPTVMLVKLVEDYYKWEHEGGARASLFNPYGAQAPDPLAPDDFSNRLSRAFPDPFTAPGQPFMGINPPPDDEDRFAKLQASLKEDAIKKAGSRLNRIFDQNLTPYRYSAMDSGGNGRPPSDLILRDFNPGAPNRETVIDLDFAAPTVIDVPSIDLGEVPTLKANRVQKLIRDMQMEDEERDNFDEDDEYTKRATRDWTFPTNDQPNRRTQDWTFPKANENENRATRDWKFPTGNENQNRATRDWKFPTMSEESSNRKTHDFKFPPAAPKQNRATREWTFSAAMAEANNQNQRNSRRETKEWTFPSTTAVPVEDNRKTRDFVFPMRSPVEEVDEEGSSSDQGPNFSSSPTLGPGFRPTLRHAITEPPGGAFDDYPTIISSAPASPQRASMIDLDMAMVDDVRPSTSDSGSTATYTGGLEQMKENPFNLEDQVHLSQNNNRASYHTKSQSEPNHPIPGLLTPQQYDDKGHPTNQDPHHPSMHARGVSSVSQMQAQMKPPPHNAYHRANQRSQQLIWDGWSHSAAYAIGSDESPPLSISTDASIDSDIDEAWDNLERLTLSRTRYALRSRRTDSRDEDPRSSDTDDAYATDATYDDYPRTVRVSVGPNGRPLVDFPVPRGPGIEAMLGVDADPLLLQNALWKSSVELRDGLRASRDLLKAMKLEDVRPDVRTLEGFPEESAGLGLDMQGTVRPSRS